MAMQAKRLPAQMIIWRMAAVVGNASKAPACAIWRMAAVVGNASKAPACADDNLAHGGGRHSGAAYSRAILARFRHV